VAQAQEIRSYVRSLKSPVDFIFKHLTDRRILSAVLTSPPFLVGLTDVEYDAARERARTTLHPVQADMQAKLTKALSELREGVEAAQRLLLERTEMRADDDGQFRSAHEPKPCERLTVVSKAKGAEASGGEQPAAS
jgi:hypothetical protein